MYWPDTQTGVDVEPARKPVASAVRKFFTEGGLGQAPTVPGGDWFNQITNELLNVLAAAGIDPSKADDDQLLQAIQALSIELRNQLADIDGANLIGSMSYADLRSYVGTATKIYIYGRENVFDGGFGTFNRSLTDTSSVDDDGTNLIDGLGRRWKRQNITETSPAWFGALGNGINDCTAALQNIINITSKRGGIVHFESVGTYLTGTLTPKSNVILNLNGSTLKLKNGTNERIFDGGVAGKNFAVFNGVLDGNQANNSGNYNLSGLSVFSGWNGVTFKNITWQNIYRTSLSLTGGTKNVLIENVEHTNCGMANAFGMYAYALECWPGTKQITIKNFKVSNHYGFGIHFYGCTDYTAENLTFDTLNYGTSSIAITWTQARRGRVENINCSNVVGDNLEINATVDHIIDNVTVDSAGKRPLLMGDNGTGIINERVKIRNFKSTNTLGTHSLVLNAMKRCKFEGFDCDKGVDTTVAGIFGNDRNNTIEDSVFATDLPLALTYYKKFHLKRVASANFYVNDHDNIISTFSGPQTGVSVPTATAIYVDLNAFNNLGAPGAMQGRLRVTSNFNNQQGTYHECLFIASNNNATLNLSPVTKVNNNTARPIDITADPTNRRIVLTNNTGVTLSVSWTVELHKAE